MKRHFLLKVGQASCLPASAKPMRCSCRNTRWAGEVPALNALAFCVSVLVLAASASGAPVTPEQAAQAATNYIVKRYPPTAKAAALTITSTGRSRLAVQSVQPWVESGQTIGYIAHLNPSGYALFSADDEAPPIKLYSDRGKFWNLPPKFLRVIGLELAEDLAVLDAMKLTLTTVEPKYNEQWSALVEPQYHPLGLKEVAGEAEGTVLTQTSWDQNYPYNCKCPNGPPCDGDAGGGRAWAGCTACAVSQILRYWKQPDVVSMDHTNTDPGRVREPTPSAMPGWDLMLGKTCQTR